MASNHLLLATVVVACCVANACSSGNNAATNAQASSNGGAQAATITQHESAGAPADTDEGRSGSAGRAQPDQDLGAAGAADMPGGDSGSAGEGTNSSKVPPANSIPSDEQAHTECDLNGGCVSKCTDQTVTCDVQAGGFACEMQGFVGQTAQVACGQRAVIGTACCGGCGCVQVEVFFDGTSCWQGVPLCALDQFNNKFFDPHATGGDPQGPYMPPSGIPGTFFLGAAGANYMPPATTGSSGSGGNGGTNGGSTNGGSANGGAGAASSGAGSGGTVAGSGGTAGT